MVQQALLWLVFTSQILNVASGLKESIGPSATKDSAGHTPVITNLLVFSQDSETVISFEPKHGWLLDSENSLRLYISGFRLHSSSIAFSARQDECSSNSFVSPVYRLSSASIIELNVRLNDRLTTHSLLFLCLLPESQSKLNSSLSYKGTQLKGPFYTFVREKGALPLVVKICLVLMLFVFSGFFSGLNLGLMSLSVNDLRLLAESDDSSIRYYAKRVLPLRKRGNFLLCSIVLANVLANSLGTVLLDSLVHGLFAVIMSTAMIVLMGEIIPQAICSRYGLIIGAHTHVITWASMIITGIISYPLGFILDKILGQEVAACYTRDQIARMLTKINADIEKPELDVITGVLSLRKKTVNEVMTMLPDVYMLDKDRTTDAELLLEVHKHGFSRIPVYSQERSNVIGIVKLRDFALITPEQYHLTIKHVLEFHNHPFGHAKTTDSLYSLLQEFLKAHWHIAVVQEILTDENQVEPMYTTVGIVTLEDVFEEILQREIIEEADLFTDNRRKIRRKQAKTMDFTALAKRPVRGPSISPQLKIAIFQFLNTNVQQFTSGFISQEILKALLNCNIYATLKRPTIASTSPLHLYKKGIQYETFTLIIQGNATLECGTERIISIVGPFSYFARPALLAEGKSVKDVHRFFEHLCSMNVTSDNITNLLDEVSSKFVPDYNLIITSELHVLQIHRLVWLAAVRATQRQRGNDQRMKRLQPEQLLSNAIDEISLMTNRRLDKNNLTNLHRSIFKERNIGRRVTAMSASVDNGDPMSFRRLSFSAASLPEIDCNYDLDTQQQAHDCEVESSEKHIEVATSIVDDPLMGIEIGETDNDVAHTNKRKWTTIKGTASLEDELPNSPMNISRIFGESGENADTIDNNRGQEGERLIGENDYETNQPQRQTTVLANLVHGYSEVNVVTNVPSSNQNQTTHDDVAPARARRTRSLVHKNNCTSS